MASDPKFMQDSFDVVHGSISSPSLAGDLPGNQEIGEATCERSSSSSRARESRRPGAIMAYLGAPGDGIRSFCWTNPEQRERFRKIGPPRPASSTKIIFDDLFMFNCRCELCQRARGNKELDRVPAGGDERSRGEPGSQERQERQPQDQPDSSNRPNWYDQYQFSGYNLEAQSKAFDMIYAGTETRDPDNNRHASPAIPELWA